MRLDGPGSGSLVVQTIGSRVFSSELYLYDADGINPAGLASNLPGCVNSPSFRTDGLSVVYTHDVASGNPATGWQFDAPIFLRQTGLRRGRMDWR